MIDHIDVVIVGAGISGISAAWHIQQRCPSKRYVIFERRDNLGGTWDLFTYPGIRSDSDMFTLGFRFKPWTSNKSIADGPAITNYLHEAVREYHIDRNIRYGHRVVRASWNSHENVWHITVQHDDVEHHITCSFLFVCSGYYNYDEGYSPEFTGMKDFTGTIVHPQSWPDDLDYIDKKIIIIGSGATAVTLVPALVHSGAHHVTMVQRSPTYIGVLPEVDPFTVRMNSLLPAKVAYVVNRWRNILFQSTQYWISRRFPKFMRQQLITMVRRRLPEGYDVDRHFTPRYNVWDQRLCLAPDGDFFRTISKGQASIVTDTIERFTAAGVLLRSGEELSADIIVTATGLNLQLFGGAVLDKDGEQLDLTTRVAYKGLMLSGVPNMAFTIGYTNASWTLKADLVSEFVCRVINYMDSHGYNFVEPKYPGAEIPDHPLLDFTPGYVLRALDQLPKAGAHPPWRLKQNYLLDMGFIRYGSIDDKVLQFSRHLGAEHVSNT